MHPSAPPDIDKINALVDYIDHAHTLCPLRRKSLIVVLEENPGG